MIQMSAEGMFSFSMASMVEDIIREHGSRLSDTDLASRKAEEAYLRRYKAAGWLRKTVGVVAAKDLPAEPSEEDFRIGLRSGIILCNVLNKVQPGAVPKVVEAPNDSVVIPDGAALMAYQYFENVRNFMVAMEEMGLPTFEASDLEQGGKTARIVNCVLALKSYSEWKQGGGCGLWKYGGNVKPTSNSGKPFIRKNSEPFMTLISRNSSVSEESLEALTNDGDPSIDFSYMNNTQSLNVLIRSLVSDKKQEEIPSIIESMLNNLMKEFEHRLARQNVPVKTISTVMPVSSMSKPIVFSEEIQVEKTRAIEREENDDQPCVCDLELETHAHEQQRLSGQQQTEHSLLEHQRKKKMMLQQWQKKQRLLEKQQRDIQAVKHDIHSTRENMQVLQMAYQEELDHLGKHLHSLAYAASGYQKVLEENRKLYNQVQDLKGNIRVYCRVRPVLQGQSSHSSTVDDIEEGNITVIVPSKNGKVGKKSFNFNRVFGPSATQEEVFSDTQPLVRSILDGYNVCIFAYGQTGSGKTYTMTGPDDLSEETFGVNYRSLNDLFLLAEQRKDTISYDVSVQMTEIYNETVRDLLVTDGSNKKYPLRHFLFLCEIRNSSQNGINVPDANMLPVLSTSDVVSLMKLGQKNRAVSATALNDHSSRSHSCLTVHVQGKDLTSGAILHGCMHLVDLAGSERVDKSEVTGDRLKEAQHINKSLSALGDVIASLAQKNTHVPYRNSKLTQLLQDALGGHAKTLMFVHISPEPDSIGETLSTLKFAERVSTVELGSARVNREMGDVKELKEQIASLKAALAKKEEEMEHLSSSVLSSSPESLRVKSTSSSPSHPQWRPVRDTLGGRRHPIDDVGNIKVKNSSVMEPRRRSLDPQYILTDSPPCPTFNGHKEDEKDVGSGDWIDKVLVKPDTRDKQRSYVNFEENYQQVLPCDTLKNPSNGFVLNKNDSEVCDMQRSSIEPATADDSNEIDNSNELDIATIDSSELDFLVQVSLPRVSSLPNGLGSKTKNPQPKSAKTPEMRTLIPAPPSRRLSYRNGVLSIKNGKLPVYVKKKTGDSGI
ncbi:hypothetical protein Nepgr_014976 [Nepenthes gracilis]|uniref:Uncharacterized protein n=1 Tax=Nepenthes gracilis TaxID=150966 RepID=A0AAD3SM15_NEPGR|nr:hypothetical protein Nepgr_014976 [Nepenthes gracilis]